MSGTSTDGIDAVVAEISRRSHVTRARILSHVHTPFRRTLTTRILTACLQGTARELCELNVLLGEAFARAALSAIHKAGLKPSQIAAIGSHGQTFHHLPNTRPPTTLQLGEPSVIAERTGVLTIADFRPRDVAAGGQGAPLVPMTDYLLFSHPRNPRIIQNIGGIANLTWLPPGASMDQVLAFDTGPGNMLIDACVRELTGGREPFDRGGRLAARGQVREELVRRWMRHPFIRKKPPKTTGREEFGAPFMARVLADARRAGVQGPDLVATVTAFTAESIADAYRRFVFPRLSRGDREHLEVVLGGGGARNQTLRRMLAERAGARRWLTHEDFGIANEAKEALAFALLAWLTLHQLPGNVPSATGASHPVILGKIVPAGRHFRLFTGPPGR
jgi:anhydro-N-acetylmuramic acid kinase